MTIPSKSNKTSEEEFSNVTEIISANRYFAITHDIQVAVWPEFIDSKNSIIGDLFVWAYHVRIDNKSLEPIKLIKRHWRIIDEKGVIQEVDGDGVIGEQPTILPNNSYQYSSGIHLRYPSGIMSGQYQMKKDNGEIFNVTIPTFSLDVPTVTNVIN